MILQMESVSKPRNVKLRVNQCIIIVKRKSFIVSYALKEWFKSYKTIFGNVLLNAQQAINMWTLRTRKNVNHALIDAKHV